MLYIDSIYRGPSLLKLIAICHSKVETIFYMLSYLDKRVHLFILYLGKMYTAGHKDKLDTTVLEFSLF